MLSVIERSALPYPHEGSRYSKPACEKMHQAVDMPKLDQKIVSLEERLQRLKQEHRQFEARRRKRESRQTKHDEARRRDLVGGVVLTRVEEGKLEDSVLRGWLEEGLTEAEDRELFGMPMRSSRE